MAMVYDNSSDDGEHDDDNRNSDPFWPPRVTDVVMTNLHSSKTLRISARK